MAMRASPPRPRQPATASGEKPLQGVRRGDPRGAPEERRDDRERRAGALLGPRRHGASGSVRRAAAARSSSQVAWARPATWAGSAAWSTGPSRMRRRTSALAAPGASTRTWRAAPMTRARKVTRARCGSTCVGAAIPSVSGASGGEAGTAREARQDVAVGADPQEQQVEDRVAVAVARHHRPDLLGIGPAPRRPGRAAAARAAATGHGWRLAASEAQADAQDVRATPALEAGWSSGTNRSSPHQPCTRSHADRRPRPGGHEAFVQRRGGRAAGPAPRGRCRAPPPPRPGRP